MEKKNCKCTGPWDCQCEEVTDRFYGGDGAEDKKAPVEEDPIAILIKHTKDFYVFGEKVDTVQLDKYQQAVKSAMQEFASQKRQRTFQECIERLDFKSTGCGGEFTEGLDYAIEILRKLKK